MHIFFDSYIVPYLIGLKTTNNYSSTTQPKLTQTELIHQLILFNYIKNNMCKILRIFPMYSSSIPLVHQHALTNNLHALLKQFNKNNE